MARWNSWGLLTWRITASRTPLILTQGKARTNRLNGKRKMFILDVQPNREELGHTAAVFDGAQLKLWVRDSEHESNVSSREFESRSGDVVTDMVIDQGHCLA
jgi:hypothetical protein